MAMISFVGLLASLFNFLSIHAKFLESVNHVSPTNNKTSFKIQILVHIIDIDECPQSLCQYKCNNTEGSFVCTCPKGYLLTTNKRDCAGKMANVV